MPPHNSPDSELSRVRAEILSIESLLHDVLQRQTHLCSRLADLQRDAVPSNSEHPPDSSVPGPSWASVAAKGRRLSLPLFSPDEDVDGSIPLFNSFSPLEKLTNLETDCARTAPQPATRVQVHSKASRKRRHANSPTNLPTVQGKRARRVPLLSSPVASPISPSLPDAIATGLADAGDLAGPANLASLATAAGSASLADANSLPSAPSIIFPPPDYILVGDSIIRHVAIPKCITYSFSGAKVLDLVEHIPSIIESYPSANTVIIHVGINDTRCRQSIKLQSDYETLAGTIESLGKICIFSGMIPTLRRRSSESFSRIYSSNQWLRNYSSACGYEFIDHFDSFWNAAHLYKFDNLHPNNKGIAALASNISRQLSTHKN